MRAGAAVALASRGAVSLLMAVTAVLAGPRVSEAGEVFTRPLPPGFAAPVVPADNPMTAARVALGEQLFADRRLSVNGEQGCVSCHDPARAFTDGRPRAIGALGQPLRRNAPSILYSAWNPALGWDAPGSATLESQMQVPLFATHPVELGLAGVESRVLAALQADEALRSRFVDAFPGEAQPVTMDNVIKAIATYERSLGEGSSAFDRYLFADDRSGFNEAALRGFDLFFSPRLGCSDCHSGMTFSGAVRSVADLGAEPQFADNGYRTGEGEGGLGRVPSLRNVAVTAPYMRDGGLPTLAAVIEHYDRGSPEALPPRPALHLSPQEKADLAAFLESLTDQPWVGLIRSH
jgi:cytochrome c peroxidase